MVFLLASIPFPLRAAEKEAPALTSNVDVLQAIASAGGPDEFAKLSRIKIFRREGGKTAIIPFDYGDVIAGENLGRTSCCSGGRGRRPLIRLGMSEMSRE